MLIFLDTDAWALMAGYAKVGRALEALISPDALSTEEQELYFEKLSDSNWAASPTEDKFFTDLRARGGAVGMDESGKIIRTKPRSRTRCESANNVHDFRSQRPAHQGRTPC